jgi:Type IV secretion system pilin
VCYTILMFFYVFLAPLRAMALSVQQVTPDPCIIGGLKCGDPFAEVGAIITSTWLYGIFGIVLFLMLIVYGVILIINSRNDSAQADAISSYVNAFIGTLLAASSSFIAGLVIDGGARRNPDLLNWTMFSAATTDVLAEVYAFIKAIVIGLFILNLFVNGVRLIVSTDDGEAQAAWKGLTRAVIGAIIVLVAFPIINAVVPGSTPTGAITTIKEISQFLITFVGGLAVVGLVAAGVMYVVSIDEGLKERANKLIITCIITLIVVAAAYALLLTL